MTDEERTLFVSDLRDHKTALLTMMKEREAAADEIEELTRDLAHEREARREGERLLRDAQGALAPFVKFGGGWQEPQDYGSTIAVSARGRHLYVADFNEARAFLASASPKAWGNEHQSPEVDRPGGTADPSTEVEDGRGDGPLSGETPSKTGRDPRHIPPASSSGQAPIPTEHQDPSKWVSHDPGAAPLPIPSEAAAEAQAKQLMDNANWLRAEVRIGFHGGCPDLTPNKDKLALADAMDAGASALRAIDHPAGEVARGFRLVPEAALHWLMGSGPDADGYWFGDEAYPYEGAFWWRTHFRRLLSSAPQPPKSNSGGM